MHIARTVREDNDGSWLCQMHSAVLCDRLRKAGYWAHVRMIFPWHVFVETKDYYIDAFPEGYGPSWNTAKKTNKDILMFSKKHVKQNGQYRSRLARKYYKSARLKDKEWKEWMDMLSAPKKSRIIMVQAYTTKQIGDDYNKISKCYKWSSPDYAAYFAEQLIERGIIRYVKEVPIKELPYAKWVVFTDEFIIDFTQPVGRIVRDKKDLKEYKFARDIDEYKVQTRANWARWNEEAKGG